MKRFFLFTAIILVFMGSGYFIYQLLIPTPIPYTKDLNEDFIEGSTEKPKRSIYDIKADYDGRAKIQAEMDLTYVNNTEDDLEELCFHLYPNIFASSKAVPFPKSDLPLVFPRGFSPGGIKILSARQGGHELERTLLLGDQILKLALRKPVAPGDVIRVNIIFNVTVPYANFRFGYQEFGRDKITMSLGNWYPVLAVWEAGEWNTKGPQAVGDWTYSDIADYRVHFTVPKGFTVAASGVLQKSGVEGNKETYYYGGEKLRDFAAALSNNYEIAEDMVSGIKIFSYYHPQDKKGGFMALNIAKHALNIFNKNFGAYPYPELRIAEANYYCGGMEFPTFIIMDSGKYREAELYNTSFERSLAHEVAHQWFYNVVGNDQVGEPWVDEAITEFSTLYYFEQRYGTPGREAYYGRYVQNNRAILRQSPRNMLDPLTKFSSRWDYFPVVYINGVLFYEELRERIGPKDFREFFQDYYETFEYKNVSLAEFQKFLRGRQYEALDEGFYEKWFK